VRAADRIGRLFRDRLAGLAEACDPGFGYDLVRLSAPVTERYAPAQASLADAAGGSDQAGEIGHLIDRLSARLGRRRVTRLSPQDTHIPEFAAAAVPAHAARTSAPPRLFLPSPPAGEGSEDRSSEPGEGGSRRLRAGGMLPHPPRSRMLARHPLPRGERERQTTPFPVSFAFPEAEADTLAPARPVRLFARPERIEVIAEVPDGPPLRFRWRRVLHEVAAAEGPERIALEWWRDAEGEALTRDYFRIECRAGARVWLFREGLYIRETAAPRWFLHGLFG
jgi:protein ImuB